ncbi:MAG: ATP-binding protein [Clostridia bacterium]|nr:ATP-binding protein [Clostridia bacterium]
MYTRENFALAKEEIEKRRLAAIAEADARNLELRARSPRIAEIDAELTKTGLTLFKIACSGGDLAPLRERNEALMKERREVLISLGLPEDYTEVHYSCPKCRDAGFVGTKMCSCLREIFFSKNLASSGMGRLVDKQSFDNFDLAWYAGSEDEARRMKTNVDTARRFAEGFGTHRDNLLLIGSTGTGKTHITTAIAKEVISRGFSVLYDSAQNIVSAFENDRFRAGRDRSEPESDKFLECELLIIDDLGAEFSNQFTVSALYNLISTRQNRGLSTIISTNLSAEELAGKYDGRIYSRIVGSDYRVLFFSGRDHRIFK